MLDRGAHHEVGVFTEGHSGVLAVHLGRRGDDDHLLLLVGVLQHDFRAVHVRFDRPHRLFDDQAHADGRGEVIHDVAAIDQLGQQRLVFDRVDGVVELGVVPELVDVLDRSRRQVIDGIDLVALRHHRLAQVGANEPHSSGDQYTHSVVRSSRCKSIAAGT